MRSSESPPSTAARPRTTRPTPTSSSWRWSPPASTASNGGWIPGAPLNRDPETLSDQERAAQGVERLPTTLAEALDALEADDTIAAAMGEELLGSYLEVKRSEWAQSTDEDGEWESDYLDRAF